MKTKNLKPFYVIIMAITLLLLTYRANAANYLTIYMDSVQMNDTLAVCNNFDTIRVIPINGVKNPFWFGYIAGIGQLDTIYVDTLYLKGNFKGELTCQGSDGVNWQSKWIGLMPLTISITQDWNNYHYIQCNSTTNLNVVNNYTGNAKYSWSPVTGLNNPDIANPVATVNGIQKYMVTFSTPEGCTLKDSISIAIHPMDSPSICIVDIDSTNKNRVIWDRSISQSIDSFYVYKETNVTDIYEKIGAVSYNSYGMFTDTSSRPDVQSNRYEISIKDVCGLESLKSIPNKTMHLSVNQGQNNTWNLIWEPYEGFTVSSYNIYRGVSRDSLKLLGSTSGGGATQYSDLNPPAGDVFYQVEVISPNICNPWAITNTKAAIVSSSRSNIANSDETGININSIASLFSVYPNPVDNLLYIETNQLNINNGLIEISDIEGKLMQSVAINSSKTEMDISHLKSGFYLVYIKTGAGATTQKIVKK